MNQTTQIAITGVDGTGKTTVVREVQKRFRTQPTKVYAFRAPQYHEDPWLPFSPLSEMIENLSQAADQRGDVTLKAVALFLSMTLYGDIQRHLTSTFQPRVLFSERQCVLDTLAYSEFYLPLLARQGDASWVRRSIVEALGLRQVVQIESWLQVVALREPSIPLRLDTVTDFMIQACQGSPNEVIQRLLRIYNARLPDQVILLTTSRESLLLRLHEKKAQTPVTELHEQAGALSQLVLSLRKICEFLQMLQPSIQIHELNTTGLAIDETVHSVLTLAGISEH